MSERRVAVPEGRTVTQHFCPTCGTVLYWLGDCRPGRIGVALGAFADPRFPAPVRSVYERSKHPWFEFTIEIAVRDPGSPDDDPR